jgi:hypothetical protein
MAVLRVWWKSLRRACLKVLRSESRIISRIVWIKLSNLKKKKVKKNLYSKLAFPFLLLDFFLSRPSPHASRVIRSRTFVGNHGRRGGGVSRKDYSLAGASWRALPIWNCDHHLTNDELSLVWNESNGGLMINTLRQLPFETIERK